jgi:DNA-binding response OmpR family regulator
MNILIIEDDQFFAEHLRRALRTNTMVHRVDIVNSFQGFLSMFAVLEGYDIILTDIRLSRDTALIDFDGFHIIKTIREANIRVPIIVISGRDEIDKIQGAFELWANDYIIKGIRIKELEIRVIQWFKHYHLAKLTLAKDNIYTYKQLEFHLDENEFFVDTALVPLTKKNKYILSIFFTQPEKLLSESYLIGKIWWDVCIEIRRNVRINILRLRQALSPFGIDSWIRTVRAEWYIFSGQD